MAPQGVGAALGMNRAGRLTDRVGGGRVVVPGLLMLMLGPVVFTQVSADTPYWLLAASLVVRGVGLGFTMMPAMAAAYATIERSQVPRATPTLNVLQRVGGSIGIAILAVVLQREITAHVGGAGAGGGLDAARAVSGAARERVAEPLAAAFGATYWWAMAITALALIPAGALGVIEHRAACAEERAPTPPPRQDPRPAPDHARAPLG